jgi:CPA1 family monovalent cation:H+ antiporter
VLGAILSPTDAVATEAIAEEVGMSRRLAAVINGESLVNDATGLVIYKFAVAAVVTGAFSLVAAVTQFVWVTVAGLALGVGIAWAIARLMIALRKQGLSDEVIAVAISLVTPFALYVPADALGASGVLAAMSGGIYLSRKSFDIFSADERLAVRSIWSFLFFVFNGGAFILIGLQLPTIMRTLRVEAYGLATILGWALAMSLVVIAVRFLWVFPVSRLRRALIPRLVAREGPAPRWSHMTVLAAAGMRGIVSLAAALALPEAVASGAPFPARDLVLFVTFVVILVTLVGEGLLLPVLIRALGVGETESDDDLIALARVRTAEAALERLCSLEQAFSSVAEWEIASVVRAEYEQRLTHERSHLDAGASGDGDAHVHRIERTLRMEVSTAERYALVQLRRHGAITDEVYRRIELDIDLTESRLHR